MLKVLITGAAGRVGSVIARLLNAEGFDLRLVDRRPRRDLPVPIEVIDLLDRTDVYRVTEGCDAVVHLGNHPNFDGSVEAERVYAENGEMNINVFQAALELGVHKVVFVSSIQVINGNRRTGDSPASTPPSQLRYLPLDGDTPPNPRNPYSLSKLAGEDLLRYYLAPAGIQSIAVRLPWCAEGEHWEWTKQHAHHPIRPKQFIDEALAYLHAEDMATLTSAILKTDLPGYRVYLPASDGPMRDITIPELLSMYFAGVPLRKPVSELTSLVDISRITAETGWRPKRHILEDRAAT